MTLFEYLKSGISKETELYSYYIDHQADFMAINDEYQAKLGALKHKIMMEFIKDKGLEKEHETSPAFYDYINNIEDKFMEKTMEGVSYDEMKKIYVDRLVHSFSNS